MGQWVTPVRYTRASLYGVSPGKYPSGVAFNDAPTGADSQLSALYPTSSVGVGAADDNKQYFAALPEFGAYPSSGRNTIFALDQTVSEWGYEKPSTTGSYLDASLSGSVPFVYESSTTEPTYVKMRKFVVGFQGGFDGQSPATAINVGSDIAPGNTQGLDCTDINSAGSIAYKQCIAALGNADEFDINLIVAPGIVHQHHPYVTNLIVDMCETRQDCFYIMDLHVTPSTEGSVGQIDEVVGYADSYDTSYAAAYYPWVKILDTNTNKIVTVPPSVVLPAVYAANDKVAGEWWAPIGLSRGGIEQAVQVCDRTTHAERDTLYEGRVNAIAAFPGQGISVWGQKTLQVAESALDRVAVRRLLINVKKFFASTAKYLIGEPNVASTRNKFLSIVTPYLESIQQRSGLYAFQVQMNDDNNTADLIDRNILYGKIWLKPTRTSEFIVLDFDVTSTGASFGNA
jgi:phage tail sheath protein FI